MRRLEQLNAVIDILARCGLFKKAANTDLSGYYDRIIPPIDKSAVSPLINYLNGNFAQRLASAATLRLAGIDTSTFPQGFIDESRELIKKHPEIISSDTIPPKVVDEFMGLIVKYPELHPLATKLGKYMSERLSMPAPSYDRFWNMYDWLAKSVRLPAQDAAVANRLAAYIRHNKQVDPGVWYHLARLYLKAAASQGKLQEIHGKIINAGK